MVSAKSWLRCSVISRRTGSSSSNGRAWLTVPYFWISGARWLKWGWAVMPPLWPAVFFDIGILLFKFPGTSVRCVWQTARIQVAGKIYPTESAANDNYSPCQIRTAAQNIHFAFAAGPARQQNSAQLSIIEG